MSNEQEEAQKTLEEMKRRVEEFQQGKIYTSPSSSSNFSSSPNLKLILTIIGVVVVLVISVIFYVKSGSQKAEMKALPGQKIIYPQNGPPRLAPR